MVGSWETLEHGGRGEELLHELEEMNKHHDHPQLGPSPLPHRI